MTTAPRILLLSALALAATHGAAAEPSSRDFKDVVNTSYVEPDGDRALQLSIDVNASVHEVYAAFTTTAGFTSWAVPLAKVDLRIGGYIEASYDGDSKLGDPRNIRNQIVAYVPDRWLVLHNVQAPPEFADPEYFGRTVTMIEFVALGSTRTHVTLTNAGYGPGEQFDRVYRHFDWGDAYTLEELKKRFSQGPVNWAQRAAQEHAAGAAKRVESH
jgi:uncharacterized protein YndB with AHSA1/START domain